MHKIAGEEKLLEIFECWPSFHDANILEWRREAGAGGVGIILVIHLFRMTSDIDESGYFRLEKHTRATLRFDGCADVQLSEFDTGIIFTLKITEIADVGGPKLDVAIDSSYGLDGTFKCDRVEVIDVQPYSPPMKQSSPNLQSPDSTPASVTPAAGQPARQP
jgi:hypothetical protein